MTVHDIRHLDEYAAVQDHLLRWHEPAFGRPHALSEPEVSTDGSRVLVTGGVLDRLEGSPHPRLFTVDGGAIVPIGPTVGSSRAGRIAPDGERFAFAHDADGAGVFQLFVGAFADAGAGADAVADAVTAAPSVPGTVEYLQWSPDGARILLGVAGLGADMSGSAGSGSHGGAAGAEALPSWHPLVESGEPDDAWRTVWIYEVESDTIAQASPAGLNCWEASWCGPDALVAIAGDSPSEDAWYQAALVSIDRASGVVEEVLSSEVQLGLPAASPDGRFVSVVQAVCSDREIVAGDLIVLDRTTGERVDVDTARVDVTRARWYANDRLGFVGQRGLDSVFGAYDASTRSVHEVPVREVPVREVLSVPRSWGYRYPDAAFTASGEAVLVEDAYDLPHQVVRVTDAGVAVLGSVAHTGTDYLLSVAGTAEPASWTAPDGLEIEGVLVTPAGEGPFPLVVNIHGGPVWAFQNAWSMSYGWVPLLASRGYAVLSPNPRGSGGRGQDFASRVVGDMGGADTFDYLSGIDALVERGIVDPARIGLIGGSYGGFMSSWLVTQDPRFAAAVPISPVTDWYSQSFTSNIAGWGTAFLRADPEVAGTMVHTRSPVLHASKARTPCLNVAGGRDRCTPPEQAREFHQALSAHGVESALVIYPEEGHGVRSYSVMTDFLTRVTMWFERHMPA